MNRFPESYGSINAIDLLRRIGVSYSEEVYREKAKLLQQGPNFVERMNEFYEWCYKNNIQPL